MFLIIAVCLSFFNSISKDQVYREYPLDRFKIAISSSLLAVDFRSPHDFLCEYCCNSKRSNNIIVFRIDYVNGSAWFIFNKQSVDKFVCVSTVRLVPACEVVPYYVRKPKTRRFRLSSFLCGLGNSGSVMWVTQTCLRT